MYLKEEGSNGLSDTCRSDAPVHTLIDSFRTGQDKRVHRRSAAIHHNRLSREHLGKMRQQIANYWQLPDGVRTNGVVTEVPQAIPPNDFSWEHVCKM